MGFDEVSTIFDYIMMVEPALQFEKESLFIRPHVIFVDRSDLFELTRYKEQLSKNLGRWKDRSFGVFRRMTLSVNIIINNGMGAVISMPDIPDIQLLHTMQQTEQNEQHFTGEYTFTQPKEEHKEEQKPNEQEYWKATTYAYQKSISVVYHGKYRCI